MQAQRFVNIVLLPHVRRDIRDNRRLHFALFQSLKKACYKPDAFYKVCSRAATPSCVHLHTSLLVWASCSGDYEWVLADTLRPDP
jgi:Bystin